MQESRRVRSGRPRSGAARWRTSSYSGLQGNCVEVRRSGDVVSVRDTKDREGGTLLLARHHWAAFVEALKNGHHRFR